MGPDVSGLSAVDHGGRHQAKTRVMVVVIVPAEEALAESASILDGAKARRELRPILHGAELAFRIWIVIGDVRTAVRFNNAQVGQQQLHGFGFHRRAAIGMQRELTGRDVLRSASVLDQTPGQLGAFAVGDHPTHPRNG